MSPEEVAEVRFVALLRKTGVPMPNLRKYDPQPPIADDGETDCWTHAWEYAHQHGGQYFEGICFKGKGAVAPHAWVVTYTPFGLSVVETTEGYERAYGYRGVAVKMHEPMLQRPVYFEGRRYSIIQLCIAGGIDPMSVIDQGGRHG